MKKIFVAGVLILAVVLLNLGDDYARPSGLPESYVSNGYYGAVYRRPAVATDDRSITYWAQDIAEDYTVPRAADAPARLVRAELSGSCHLPAPSQGALVQFVEIYAGYDEAPLHFVSHKSIEAVRRHLESGDEDDRREPKLGVDTARQVDVFVTESERPVYLVLESYDATIWSLQLAEGARLDGVAVIGYEAQALAHAPGDARIGFAVYDDSPQYDCMVMPQRPVNETWKALALAGEGRRGEGFRRTVDKASDEHYSYRNWLRPRVGDPDRAIDAYRTAHVLVGPRPDTPLRYRPLEDAQVLVTPNAFPVWTDKDDVADAIRDYVSPGS